MKHVEFLNDGEAYLKAAQGGKTRPEVFNAEIVYNLLAMSIEKNFMAILIFKGDMADNHTFSDMIDSVERHMKLEEDLVDGLKLLEETQNICPIFEGYHRHEPDASQLDLMYGITERIKLLAHNTISAEVVG